jgi:phosphatidylcholine synthase
MAAARDRLLEFCAWLIHFYTACGAVTGLVALWLVARNDFRSAFMTLALAVFIDSTDGPLARALDVRRRIPVFDGATLDNLVDYLNYVVVPTFLMLNAGILIPNRYGLAVAAFVVLASAYAFCRVDAKTADRYFRGFPSYWNFVALYLFCLGFRPRMNMLIIVFLAVLEFAPIKFIYPNRTVPLRMLTLSLASLWAAATIALVFELPGVNLIMLYTSLTFVVYYFVMSLALQFSSPLSTPLPEP